MSQHALSFYIMVSYNKLGWSNREKQLIQQWRGVWLNCRWKFAGIPAYDDNPTLCYDYPIFQLISSTRIINDFTCLQWNWMTCSAAFHLKTIHVVMPLLLNILAHINTNNNCIYTHTYKCILAIKYIATWIHWLTLYTQTLYTTGFIKNDVSVKIVIYHSLRVFVDGLKKGRTWEYHWI